MHGSHGAHPIETPVRPTALKIGTTTVTDWAAIDAWADHIAEKLART